MSYDATYAALPHPDLSRVLDADTANDMILKLDRDQNGKPVDKLFIYGKVSEENAAKLEALLWDDMGEVEHLKIATKEFMGEAFINHPLLLTQLVLSYHMVKAAQGITAL